MAPNPVESLLADVAAGRITPEAARARLGELATVELGFARLDGLRDLRQGAPEAVLAEGKTPTEVVAIVTALADVAGSVLVTRADDDVRAAVRAALPEAQEHVRARAVWVARRRPPPVGRVTIVSAGTSDGAVAHEARIRAELLGTEVVLHEDVGVAGLHRVLDVLPDLRAADCVVVCAGMDGALVSVVGGLVAAPVIGVPTSTGYGAARNGETALYAMLASCAAGVAVVGVDDGFGAGTISAVVARRAHAGGDRP